MVHARRQHNNGAYARHDTDKHTRGTTKVRQRMRMQQDNVLVRPLEVNRFQVYFNRLHRRLIKGTRYNNVRRVSTPRYRVGRTAIARVARVGRVTLRPDRLTAVFLAVINRYVVFTVRRHRYTNRRSERASTRHRYSLASLHMLRTLVRHRGGAGGTSRVVRRSPQ